jgi:uncharacterized iron-regulated membrane protein
VTNFSTTISPRRALLWRVHGLAAMLATPFLLVAAITGLVYVPAPQIDAWQLALLERSSGASQAVRPLDELVAAASAAAPGRALRSVRPPHAAGDSAQVIFEPTAAPTDGRTHAEHGASHVQGALTVYVDAGTAHVLGLRHEMERFGPWAKRLHSQLLLGEGWRWMIEWAATCLLVMLVTGAALAWPQRGRPFWPRGVPRGAQARAVIKQWHGVVGLVALVMSAAIVLTGLTWSRYAGTQIRTLRDAAGQAPPRVPASLKSQPVVPGAARLSWQAVWEEARRRAPDVAMHIGISPQHGTWRVASADTRWPTRRFETHLDAYSGAVLFHAGWKEQTAFAKATAIGIPLHRGEFGWWNQALLVVFGVTVLFSTVTGWVMWWKRSRGRAWALAPLPRPVLQTLGRARWLVIAGTVLVAWLVPLLCAFALCWAVSEGKRMFGERVERRALEV